MLTLMLNLDANGDEDYVRFASTLTASLKENICYKIKLLLVEGFKISEI